MKIPRLLRFPACLGLIPISALGLLHSVRASSATWNLNPVSNDWDMPENWTPTGPPGDTAFFGVSNITALTFSRLTFVSQIEFQPGASSYTLITNPWTLVVNGHGIINNSGVLQSFVAAANPDADSAVLELTGNAVVGDQITYTSEGETNADHVPPNVQFQGSASAGTATFVNEGGLVPGAGGGATYFFYNSTGANATITNKPGAVSGALGGVTAFSFDKATAGNAIVTSEGATVAGAGPGRTVVDYSANAGSATFIALGGVEAGGGIISFIAGSEGGFVRVEIFDNGLLDISEHAGKTVSIGSLEGNGQVILGSHTLSVGSNNLSTTFSGVIQGLGSLTKIGTGTLTLDGANTYTGSSCITAGTLLAANAAGSATGTGQLFVDAGTLGGNGIIAGAVTVGTGSGLGAFLAPSLGPKKQSTLTIQSALTFNADATYTYTFRARGTRARSDQVIANGVTIDGGAFFAFQGTAQGTLPIGLSFTAIKNTSASPMNGKFSNLADGAILTANGNNFQANYEGGDGNDLTLTVIP